MLRAGNAEHSQDIFCLVVFGQPRSPRTQGHRRSLERRAVPSPGARPFIFRQSVRRNGPSSRRVSIRDGCIILVLRAHVGAVVDALLFSGARRFAFARTFVHTKVSV